MNAVGAALRDCGIALGSALLGAVGTFFTVVGFVWFFHLTGLAALERQFWVSILLGMAVMVLTIRSSFRRRWLLVGVGLTTGAIPVLLWLFLLSGAGL